MTFAEFINTVKEAGFSFSGIRDWILWLYRSITHNEDIINIWDYIFSAFLNHTALFCLFFIAAGVFIALFGQRFAGIIKFLVFFVIGFTVGTHYLSPLLPAEANIKSWAVGIAFAIICAVLYKYLYYGLLSVAVGYTVYRFCYTIFFTSFITEFSVFRCVVSIIIAISCIVGVIIANKWTELVISSFGGAYLAVLAIDYGILHFSGWFGGEMVTKITFALLLAVGAFIFQFKKRDMYQ